MASLSALGRVAARLALGVACGCAGWACALVVAVVLATVGYGGVDEALRGLGRAGSQRAMMAFSAASLGSIVCGLICGAVAAARPPRRGWAWRSALPACAVALAVGAASGTLIGGQFAGPDDAYIYTALGLSALAAAVGAAVYARLARAATR